MLSYIAVTAGKCEKRAEESSQKSPELDCDALKTCQRKRHRLIIDTDNTWSAKKKNNTSNRVTVAQAMKKIKEAPPVKIKLMIALIVEGMCSSHFSIFNLDTRSMYSHPIKINLNQDITGHGGSD